MRILVVDDSPTSRSIVARLIGDSHEVIPAAGGVEALEAMSIGRFDLVLLDLLMPGMDGKAVLASLAERGSTTPVVVITADIQETTRSRLLELGARGVINKPLTRERIVSAIEIVLRSSLKAASGSGKGPL